MNPLKFIHPDRTAKGEQRAFVELTQLQTLWFNTGSLCNITCNNCYMESSPTNDRLEYLSLEEVETYLEEISSPNWSVEEIAFTGGEPFMNQDLVHMLENVLSRGYRALVLTNAMKPLLNNKSPLLSVLHKHGNALTIRVSIDHYTKALHESVRGINSWEPMIQGLKWLSENGFKLSVAGRNLWGEHAEFSRSGYAAFFAEHNIPVDATNPSQMILFPEMDETQDVPEITVNCWNILDVDPKSIMCSKSRMIIKRKGATSPTVIPCTLLPYDQKFELGNQLSNSANSVKLNHPHCARFCVLGGASCSP